MKFQCFTQHFSRWRALESQCKSQRTKKGEFEIFLSMREHELDNRSMASKA